MRPPELTVTVGVPEVAVTLNSPQTRISQPEGTLAVGDEPVRARSPPLSQAIMALLASVREVTYIVPPDWTPLLVPVQDKEDAVRVPPLATTMTPLLFTVRVATDRVSLTVTVCDDCTVAVSPVVGICPVCA